MRYREQLNIILMRDKGPRRSFRIRLSHFIVISIFFLCMPFVGVLLAWKCATLWENNRILAESVEHFEADTRIAEAKVEKLQLLEHLLEETNPPTRDMILRQLAGSPMPLANDNMDEIMPEGMEEGPGHEEFAVLDNGTIKVDNVQIRRIGGNGLRIGLDLRNPDSEKILSGRVGATLVTSAGEKISLPFSPLDAGMFRIKRFKRATMISRPGHDINLGDSQVIIEIMGVANIPLYRNIYSVQG